MKGSGASSRNRTTEFGVSLFLDRSPNPRPPLVWKVRVFTVGAVMALTGIYFEERWLTGASLVVLVAGALLRQSRSPMP